jgi:hypothetical protein
MPLLDFDKCNENLNTMFPRLLDILGVETRGRSCRCPSPQHEDRHYSAYLYVSNDSPHIYCHTCEEAWFPSQLVGLLCGISEWKEQIERAHDLLGLPLPLKDGGYERPKNSGDLIPKPKIKTYVQLDPTKIKIQNTHDRDRNYKKIQQQLGLSDIHFNDLTKRGLSESQIKEFGYVSINPGDRVSGTEFPGIFGGEFRIADPGFLCPVRQYGQVVAAQIRTENKIGKYKWLSGGGKYKLKVSTEGAVESPLAIMVGDQPDFPLLTEGFLKTDIVFLKTERTLIGAAGGNWTSGEAQIRSYIRKYHPKKLGIFADANSLGNPQVAQRTWGQIQKLQAIGNSENNFLEIVIADYGQLNGNLIPSPDDWLVDLGEETATWEQKVRWLSVGEFKDAAVKCGLKVEKLLEEEEKYQRQLAKSLKKLYPIEEVVVAAKNERKAFIRKPSFVDLYFPKGGRIAAIEAALASEKKYILDISPTGTGKSYTAAEMIELGGEYFGASRIIFVTQDPRNVTVEGLKSVTRIDSRHKGVTKTATGEYRVAKQGDQLAAPPSCFVPEIFTALRIAGIENADSSRIGCVSCPYFNVCKSPQIKGSAGDYPNYIYQRREGLGKSAIIIHPQSLPQPKELAFDGESFPYAKSQQGKDLGSLLYWEEFGSVPIVHSIGVSLEDLEKTFCDINFNVIDSLRFDAATSSDISNQIIGKFGDFNTLKSCMKLMISNLRQAHDLSVTAKEMGVKFFEKLWNYLAQSSQTPLPVCSFIADIYQKHGFYHFTELIASVKQVDSAGYLDLLDNFFTEILQSFQSVSRAFEIGKLVKILRKIISEDNSRFGMPHSKIIESFNVKDLMGKFTHEELKEVYEAISPKLDFLNDSFDGGELTGKEAISLRHAFTQEKLSQAEKLTKQWLHHFFAILTGQKLGHFHVSRRSLTIDLFNDRIPVIAREAEKNIFSDATLSRDRLAAILRCDSDEIFVICQETEKSKNLIIKQIPLKSYLHRGADQARRIEAAKEAILQQCPKAAIIGSKKLGDDRYFFSSHSRGTNYFYEQGVTDLILTLTPAQNLASVESEFHLLFVHLPSEDELNQYLLEKIYIEYEQAIGRPRANLREENITIWVITDVDLSPLGCEVEVVDLESLSPECLGIVDRLKRKIGEAIKAGAETCQQVADFVGVTKGRISQIAQAFGGFKALKNCLISLLDSIYSEIKQTEDTTEALTNLALEFYGEYWEHLTQTIEEDVLCTTKFVASAIKKYGIDRLKEMLVAAKWLDPSGFVSFIQEFLTEICQSFGLTPKIFESV